MWRIGSLSCCLSWDAIVATVQVHDPWPARCIMLAILRDPLFNTNQWPRPDQRTIIYHYWLKSSASLTWAPNLKEITMASSTSRTPNPLQIVAKLFQEQQGPAPVRRLFLGASELRRPTARISSDLRDWRKSTPVEPKPVGSLCRSVAEHRRPGNISKTLRKTRGIGVPFFTLSTSKQNQSAPRPWVALSWGLGNKTGKAEGPLSMICILYITDQKCIYCKPHRHFTLAPRKYIYIYIDNISN